MAGFPYGAQVVAGTDGTATAFNNGRKDGLTRWLKFEVVGPLVVGNKQGGSFLMPFAGSVVQTYMITTSGTATVRINSGANVVDSSMSASSTASTDSTVGAPTVAKNDLFTMDITAVSSGVDLVVMVEVLPTP